MNSLGTSAVTWMIPVLNGMPYLPSTMASIEQQTFQDFQVMIWDNGSTDGTVEEALRWIPAKIPGVVITGRPMLLGLARAAMVAECESGFCALVDADDVSHPDRLEKQMAFLQSHPEVSVVGTQLRQIDSQGHDRGLFTTYPLSHEQIVQEMLVRNPIGQPSVLMRRSAVLAVGNYRDFSPTHVEDYDLWLRLSAAGYRLANMPEALVDYRIHEKSTTQKSIAANRLDQESNRRLADAAPALYGCDGSTLIKLKQRKHPHAIVPLQQIAESLRAESNPWKSPIFYDAARTMINARDIQSRMSAAIEHAGMAGAMSEMKAIAAASARSLTRKLFRSKKENVNANN